MTWLNALQWTSVALNLGCMMLWLRRIRDARDAIAESEEMEALWVAAHKEVQSKIRELDEMLAYWRNLLGRTNEREPGRPTQH